MFRPYGMVGKEFLSGNNVCGNRVTVLYKRLEGDHHGVSEIFEVRVVFHFLCENVDGIDYSKNVVDVQIFRLMAFTDHVFLEV